MASTPFFLTDEQSTMTLFESLSSFANQSTIYKRHERRHEGASPQPVVQHATPHAQDASLLTTLQKFPTRSTVYKHHEDFHQDMGHANNAQVRQMQPNMAHHHDSLLDTIASFTSESSIYERNVLRNQFLHSA